MKRRHYIFTKRRNSDLAVMATLLGLISNGSLAAVLYLAYKKGGAVPVSYGLTGLLAAFFSAAGLIMAVLAIQEKDVFKLFPVLGILLNLLALGILAFVVQLGF
ncbi:MAG: hypothetical protein J6M66_12805 [Lachnospiraceae bacterium]|nr:hypothetical protein [Lachnospiraceae bacterium]